MGFDHGLFCRNPEHSKTTVANASVVTLFRELGPIVYPLYLGSILYGADTRLNLFQQNLNRARRRRRILHVYQK